MFEYPFVLVFCVGEFLVCDLSNCVGLCRCSCSVGCVEFLYEFVWVFVVVVCVCVCVDVLCLRRSSCSCRCLCSSSGYCVLVSSLVFLVLCSSWCLFLFSVFVCVFEFWFCSLF